MSEWNSDLSICKTFPLAPDAVLRNGTGFFLREGTHDSNQQLTLGVQRPDVFLLKVNLHAFFFELTDCGQAVDRISGKAADRFGNDKVNLAVKGIGDHAFEALALFGVRACNALIGINTDELPIVAALDIVGVIVYLRLVAGELLVAVGGDTGVSGCASLFLLVQRRCCKSCQRRRNCGYCFGHFFSPLI